ncbi:MAG: transcription antitermination factor NusB [Oscillospiraceae bacterium]|nr:transcription antitermination factor NusB [Oscillospiraceae bacterium]
MKKISRHQMRENAFILIFERIFHDDSVEELLNTAKECGDMEITPAVEEMFKGVESNKTIIDETISTHLKKWTMSRISKVSLAILRLGVWEILFCDDVEDDIVVSECVRLATDYAYEEDVSFVNGVLGNIVRGKNAGKQD